MTKEALSSITRLAIIASFAVGIAVCVFWYPFSVSISALGGGPISEEANLEMWAQLIFYWLVSVPCFAILIIGWKIPDAIADERIFTKETAKLFSLISKILLTDLIVYFIGNVFFIVLGWNTFALLYLVVAIAGTVVGITFSICSHYITKADFLREEYDATV